MLAAGPSLSPTSSPYGLFYCDPTLIADRYLLGHPLDYDPGDDYLEKVEHGNVLHAESFFGASTQTISGLGELEKNPFYLSPPPSDFDFHTPSLDSDLLSPSLSSDAFDKPSTSDGESDLLPHDCMTNLTNTLGSLYQLCNTHDPGSGLDQALGSAPTTIDRVLQVNKKALSNCSTVLACTCPKDGSFAVLMCTVFSKILTWYQALVDIVDPTIEESRRFSSIIRGSMMSRPFSVGAYKLDKQLERVMTHQLVLSELREMTKWVKTCVDGFCSLPSTPMTELTDLHEDLIQAQRVNSQMGALLEIRLQRTIEELEQRLVRVEQ